MRCIRSVHFTLDLEMLGLEVAIGVFQADGGMGSLEDAGLIVETTDLICQSPGLL